MGILLFYLNYLFLQAIKIQQQAWWIGYSVATVFILYTSSVMDLFSAIWCISFCLKKERRIQFVISLLTSLLAAYLRPWMYFLFTVPRQTIESGLTWYKFSHTSFFH